MENKDLMERLEELLAEEPRLQQNGNWGSPMIGKSGDYFLYTLMYEDRTISYGDLVGSHQWITIKEYVDAKFEKRYCILLDKSYDFDNLDEVINKIKSILPDN